MNCKACGKELINKKRVYCSYACSNSYRRIIERKSRKTYTTWSCGGGVQSTAIAALICTGKLKAPDYSIMVDTGYEKTPTYDYVYGFLIPELKKYNINLNIVKATDYDPCHLIINGVCVIPGFRICDDGVKKMKTMCNERWKVKVVRKWLLEQGVEQYKSYIGISTDEDHRQRKAHKKYYQNTYPLIEMGMNRDDCLKYIKDIGWLEPPRTSCLMCGLMAEGDWWKMAVRYPEDLKKAIKIEKYLQKEIPGIFLHKNCKPLEDIFKL